MVVSGLKPFRIQLMWYSHIYFFPFIKQAWDVEIYGSLMFKVMKKLKLLKQAFHLWN